VVEWPFFLFSYVSFLQLCSPLLPFLPSVSHGGVAGGEDSGSWWWWWSALFLLLPPLLLLGWLLFIKPVGVAFAVAHGSGSRGGWSAIGCYCRGSAPTAWGLGLVGGLQAREAPTKFKQKLLFPSSPLHVRGKKKEEQYFGLRPHSWPCVSLRSLVSDLCNLTLNWSTNFQFLQFSPWFNQINSQKL
jgi:hypothetical protein